MRMLAPDSEADLYAITCELALTKIGVAADARERCRALQVGSPVLLELASSYHFRRSEDAYAIAAEVKRQLADRQVGPRPQPGPDRPRHVARQVSRPVHEAAASGFAEAPRNAKSCEPEGRRICRPSGCRRPGR
jgi:hypothetical protein